MKSYKASLQKQWLHINLIQCGVYFLHYSFRNTAGLQIALGLCFFIPLRINRRKSLFFWYSKELWQCDNKQHFKTQMLLWAPLYIFRKINRMVHFQVHFLSTGIFLEQQCFTLLMLHGKELFVQQVPGAEDVFTKPISGTDVKRII